MIDKKEELNVRKQYKEAIRYIRQSKYYIYSTIILFIASAIFGFLNKENLRFLDKILAELVNKTIYLNAQELVFFILQNNLQSSVIALISGAALGIFPIYSIFLNGTVIGYVLALSFEKAGLLSWWRLLPHGIFELPAIFISFGLGIKLGFSIFSPEKNKWKTFKERFYNSFNVFLMIIIPLLIIAAIIEGLLIAFMS